MKAFRMTYPATAEEALAELAGAPEEERVQVIAGGQDLLGELKDHLVEPDALVNLDRVEGLRGISSGGKGQPTVIGAMTTLSAIAADEGILARLPMLAEAALTVGTPQIRNLGTLGGNLCQRPRCGYYRIEAARCLKKGGSTCFAYSGMSKHNAILGAGPVYIVHPSDLAPALVAYDALVEIQDRHARKRVVPLQKFFLLPSEGGIRKENVLEQAELVTSVVVPDRTGWRATYLKVKERHSYDFAMSAVALALKVDGGRIEEARLVLGGVAPTPWRCGSTEQLLLGRKIDEETCRLAGEDALRRAEPLQHNAYKIPMTRGLITKALRKLGGQE